MRLLLLVRPAVWVKFVLSVLISGLFLSLPAQFAGGQGTEEDPWQIARVEDLDNIRNYLGDEHSDKYYLQTRDLNLGIVPWNEGEGWPPIGTSQERFCGNYDGGNHVIDSLYINRPDEMRQGLFGDIQNAVITNLGITNANVTGQQYSGPLLGYGRGNSVISNCWSSGSMTGFNTSTGGLIGYIFREIVVENCYSTTDVVGNNYVGGLIGMAFRNHTIRNSYARGSVSGNQDIGGLIGLQAQDDSTIENCYSIGTVTGQENIGGLIGRNRGSPVTTSYWDTLTSGQEESAGGEGRTTDMMVYPYGEETYVRWDFNEIWRHDTTRQINDGYPVLHFHDIPALDPPVVSIEFVYIEGQMHCRISWEAVEQAQSYKVYATDDPEAEDWGEEIAHVGENVFIRPVGDEEMVFYYVISSAEEAP